MRSPLRLAADLVLDPTGHILLALLALLAL